ncbi:MAG: glycosyltransferase [Candidatus Acidulodesulfobacterium acidiphilum]|uniref:Glycosyltransferase n=1 Tax=Candidatus Acidulodesulfobacterium acidiphilum TaxID=2597224 RepID=A0A520XD94_9DELT|nr:MAG: glycosyltransferase [Candidatus Acidulodesulfobacterium acidiphilum]
MKISGFTFIRNGILMGYPFKESIMSALPLVDEFIVVVCESADQTKNELEKLKDLNPKIKLIESDWKITKKSGTILSEKTNLAIQNITGNYGLYVQCDEGIHEKDYEKILRVLEENINDKNVKGFVFDYIHFFGGYFSYAKRSEKRFFYDREVRIIRNDGTVLSWGDAMGFKDLNGVKINIENKNALPLNVNMFHYGRAKNPADMYKKDKEMERLYNFQIINRLKNWVSNYDPRIDKYIYSDFGWLERIDRKNLDFHPAPFRELASKQDWKVDDFKTFLKEKKGTSQFFKMLIYRIVKDSINETSNAYKKIRAFLKNK